MPPTITTNLGLRLPDVGFDEDTWGGDTGLNHDLSLIDAVFNAAGDGTSVGLRVGTGKTFDAHLGTLLACADRLILSDATATTKTGRLLVDLVPVGTQVDWHLPPITDTLVGAAQAQTLANKTLTAPTIATINNAGLLTLPVGIDTLVARDSVDTLTHKTLTNPVINGATLGAATATSIASDTFTTSAANVNAQTGTAYTLVNSDNGKTVTMGNAGASVLSVPSGLTPGFGCTIIQLGAGQVTISSSGAALRSRAGLKLAGQYAIAGLIYILADTYAVGGDTNA
jgi:hypothetical protein